MALTSCLALLRTASFLARQLKPPAATRTLLLYLRGADYVLVALRMLALLLTCWHRVGRGFGICYMRAVATTVLISTAASTA